MRALCQIISIFLAVSTIIPGGETDDQIEVPIQSNTIQRIIQAFGNRGGSDETRALKKVFLSNRSVTCNDGSQAGFYLRKSHSSKKWIIFLEGGWYCYDHHSCRNRWLRQRHYMTSSQWPETRDVGGILSANEEENPFWWNTNHVFIPYCTSDSWSGSKPSNGESFSFMGSAVVQQVVKDLVPLGLENSTDLLLTGSSAGGTGVMINLDPVQELVHEQLGLKHIMVKGVTDSGWFLDRTPYAPTGKPAVEAIRKGMEMWNGKVPRRCKAMHESEPWRCYFGYRLYPTLKAPLFVFQWLFDEAQMDADNVGAPVTKQQWDYIHKMGDALRHSFKNVSAVFAPSCISHSVLTKRDWQLVKIDQLTLPEALHCWEKRPYRRMRKMKNPAMLADDPNLQEHKKRRRNKLQNRSIQQQQEDQDKRKKNKQGKKGKGNKRKNDKCRRCRGENKSNHHGNRTGHHSPNTIRTTEHPRAQRSVLRNQKQGRNCAHRRLDRCSWPQCNHSCPRLHNPFTGEEMDFKELLKSFGLDMESVANALGINMQTLNNMDHSELLNLLTQQAS